VKPSVLNFAFFLADKLLKKYIIDAKISDAISDELVAMKSK
jgi:hypothetical protein